MSEHSGQAILDGMDRCVQTVGSETFVVADDGYMVNLRYVRHMRLRHSKDGAAVVDIETVGGESGVGQVVTMIYGRGAKS